MHVAKCKREISRMILPQCAAYTHNAMYSELEIQSSQLVTIHQEANKKLADLKFKYFFKIWNNGISRQIQKHSQ